MGHDLLECWKAVGTMRAGHSSFCCGASLEGNTPLLDPRAQANCPSHD